MYQITKSYALFQNQIKTLKKFNEGFTHITGRNAEQLKFGKGNKHTLSYISSDLEPAHLNYIKQVKRHARELTKERVEVPKITYYNQAKIPDRTVYNQVVEMDVNQAYFDIALHNGYLTQKLYDKGMILPKKVRLVALGSLASRKEVWEYCPKRKIMIEQPEVCDEITRSYFFDVSSQLDDIMTDIFKGFYGHVIMYWVDAFFVKNGTPFEEINNKEIINRVGECNLSVKFKELDYICRRGAKVIAKEKGKKEKIFPYLDKTTKKSNQPKYRYQFNNYKNLENG